MILPRNDLVLIERIDTPPMGTIVVPDIAQEKSILGRVLAVGPGKLIEGVNGDMVRKPVEVKVGDVVYFNSKWSDFSGSHYSDDQLYDRNLHLVMEADIFCLRNNGTNGAAAHKRGIGRGSDSRDGEAHQDRKAAKKDHHGRSA